MKDLEYNYLYIVQTRVIGIGECAFSKNDNIRTIWNQIFQNEKCISGSKSSTYLKGSKDWVTPEIPFFRDVGPIYFDPDNRFEKIVSNLKKRIIDERMSIRYFESIRPINLSANTNEDIRARGKVFIHIYPCGYLVLHFAFILMWKNEKGFSELRDLIDETRPWRKNNNWNWSSKIGKGKLSDINTKIEMILDKALFNDRDSQFGRSQWFTSMMLVSNAESQKIAQELLVTKDHCEKLEMDSKFTAMAYLLSTKQGLASVFRKRTNRRTSLRFFWKILSIAEFVYVKKQIYEDYYSVIKDEISINKNLRQNAIQKVKDELLKFSIDDHKMPLFISTLDTQVMLFKPYHRRIYSTISIGTGFSERREKMIELINEWDKESELWEPAMITIWKKIFAPLLEVYKSLPLT